MSGPCHGCGEVLEAHRNYGSGISWCPDLVGHCYNPPRYQPPTPEAEPMKSDLEILEALMRARSGRADELMSHFRDMGHNSWRQRHGESIAYEQVIRDIDAVSKRPDPDADGDHGAALAYAQEALAEARAERDKFKAELAQQTWTERDRVKEALASVEGERDKYKAALEEIPEGGHSYGAIFAIVEEALS